MSPDHYIRGRVGYGLLVAASSEGRFSIWRRLRVAWYLLFADERHL